MRFLLNSPRQTRLWVMLLVGFGLLWAASFSRPTGLHYGGPSFIYEATVQRGTLWLGHFARKSSTWGFHVTYRGGSENWRYHFFVGGSRYSEALGFGHAVGPRWKVIKIPLWAVAIVVFLPTAVLMLRPQWMVRRRRRRGHCIRCGYDLRASPSECPECGLNVKASAETSVSTTPSAWMARKSMFVAILAIGMEVFERALMPLREHLTGRAEVLQLTLSFLAIILGVSALGIPTIGHWERDRRNHTALCGIFCGLAFLLTWYFTPVLNY